MLADGGPDLERVFMAGLFTLLRVDVSVLTASPTLDVACLGAVGVLSLAGLDSARLEEALICRAFHLEAFSFFAKRCGLGLDAFAGAANLDFVLLLLSTFGDDCVSSVCAGVSTLRTPIAFWMNLNCVA